MTTLVNQARTAIRDALSGAVPGDVAPCAVAGARLLEIIPDRDALIAFLDDYLRQDAEEHPHGLSHLHVNGFMKLSLLREDGPVPWRLRLHVWQHAARDARIHNHRWSFASLMVAGEVDIHNYFALDSAAGQDFRVLRVWDADDHGEKKVETLSSGRLTLTSTYRLTEGAAHTLHYEQPHIIAHETDRLAATMVITAAPVRDFAHVYADPAEDPVRAAQTLQPGRLLPRDTVHEEIRGFQDRLLDRPPPDEPDQARAGATRPA